MKFTIEKKMVVKVRYFEDLWFIRDSEGETIFAGHDEKRAREILTLLNAYHHKKTVGNQRAKTTKKRTRLSSKSSVDKRKKRGAKRSKLRH